jgi:hypothetical protein
MNKVSRFFLLSTLILVLLTAACGAEEITVTVSYPGVDDPGGDDLDLTATPFNGIETTGPLATNAGAETATGDISTPDIAVPETSTQDTATVVPGLDATQTPAIPVTGVDVILVECQFCVDTWAHALLVLPDTTSFEVISPAPSATADTDPRCSTVEVNNGRQVVLCSGPEMTPLILYICTNVNSCTEFPVTLLSCPVQPGTLDALPNDTETSDEILTPEVTSTASALISTATP